MEISIGNLIDQLTIANLRIWKAEDIKRNPAATDKEIANATRLTNMVNKQRNDLIEAIDRHFGKETGQGSTKIYG